MYLAVGAASSDGSAPSCLVHPLEASASRQKKTEWKLSSRVGSS
jgi:hypothetical protein